MNDQTQQTDDIILDNLNDDELVLQIHDDLYDGLADEIVEGTEILLRRGWRPQQSYPSQRYSDVEAIHGCTRSRNRQTFRICPGT